MGPAPGVREVRTKERRAKGAQLGRAEMKEGSRGWSRDRKRVRGKRDVDADEREGKKDRARERALHRSREIAASFLGRQLITDIMF